MKKIALVFTGGTIAMKVSSKLQGAIPGVTPEEIVATLKEATDYDNLEAIEFSKLPSPSIAPENMYELKNTIDPFLNDDAYAGVVVVHGTDTLEETAFYLDVVSKSDKPIVVTGSMKNASELGYDGLTNLDSSIKVALSEESRQKGVLVVMNYQIHAAAEVTKTHTLNLDTFKSVEFGPLGIIDDEDVLYYRMHKRKDYPLKNAYSDNVALLKTYAGMRNDMLEHFVDAGYRGIVIEALGRGNVPPGLMEGIKKARANGLEIVIASRTMAGRVLDTYGYIGGGKDLIKNGCILAGTLSGVKARILLMIALENGLEHEQLQKIFAM